MIKTYIYNLIIPLYTIKSIIILSAYRYVFNFTFHHTSCKILKLCIYTGKEKNRLYPFVLTTPCKIFRKYPKKSLFLQIMYVSKKIVNIFKFKFMEV